MHHEPLAVCQTVENGEPQPVRGAVVATAAAAKGRHAAAGDGERERDVSGLRCAAVRTRPLCATAREQARREAAHALQRPLHD